MEKVIKNIPIINVANSQDWTITNGDKDEEDEKDKEEEKDDNDK
jgi:hypothetical protein